MAARGDVRPIRLGQQDAGTLERGGIDVAGIRRTYWLARAPGPPGGQGRAPLLILLHGPGMDGRSAAQFTGLATRGPACGITTVFPDGWKGIWHVAGPPDRVPDLDDVLFLAALSAHLEAIGAARSWPVFLAGMSNGALLAEHVARHGLLPVTGLFLVAGTALDASRRQVPVPALRTTVISIMGTGDRSMPYGGGPLPRRGIGGLILKRRTGRHGEQAGKVIVAGAEDVAADWSAANGITARPLITELPAMPDGLAVTRKTWSAPGCRSVALYRIDGGGNGWPGGPQFLPVRVTGPVARHLDATGILLDMAEQEGPAGADRHPRLERGDFR